MRRLVIFPLLFLFGWFDGTAQTTTTMELGVMATGSYYIGDVNPYFHFKGILPGGGVLVRYNLNQRMAIRGSAIFARVQGSDSWSDNAFLQQRNVDFRTPITEVAAVFEFNFFNFSPANQGGSSFSNRPKDRKNFSPYLFGGIGIFNMNPQTKVNGQWVELRTLGTEGQGGATGGQQYSQYQLAAPFGMGIKFKVAPAMTLSLEWGMRKTFTDYIDDVSGRYPNPDDLAANNGNLAPSLSNPGGNPGYDITGTQRGNPETKDWYNITALQLTYQIGDKKVCPRALY